MTRIAVMQPYFLPYAGYFRLMCDVDAFVLLEDVQFPRRGWVHRNRLRTFAGELAWLTLPLEKTAVNTQIRDLRFRGTAIKEMRKTLRRFPATCAQAPGTEGLVDTLCRPSGSPTDFIVRLFELACDVLDLRAPIIRSSDLGLAPDIEKTGRLVALCRHFGADTYVNAPGGRSLYDEATFRRYGINLQFLPDYRGPYESILQRLHEATPTVLRQEIVDNLI